MAIKKGAAILVFLAAFAGSVFDGADAKKNEPACVKEGVEYGIIKGAFRNNWWNYQERGMSYADGECYDAALADIEEAIKERDKLTPKKDIVEGHACDQRRARTYGMHFVDYFGHRERGVILFQRGDLDGAQQELEYSLACTESSKAQYFLDKARESKLKQTQADKAAPTLQITSFGQNSYTNEVDVEIKGVARDDQFVKEILINGKPILVPLAQKEIAFSQKIELQVGPNKVEVTARDLLGKSVSSTVSIYVDRAGPQLSLENIQKLQTPDYVEIRGYVSDSTGVNKLTLNGSPVSVSSGQFAARLKLGGKETISFAAEDKAGNTTEGKIHLGAKPKGAAAPQPRKYAALGSAGTLYYSSETTYDPQYMLPWGMDSWLEDRSKVAENDMWWGLWDTYEALTDDVPPEIKLKELIAEQTVYFDQLYFEGNVSDINPITSLTINNKPVIKGERKNIFFNFIVKLKPGKNTINLEAMDSKGNRAVKTVRIMRVVPKVHQINNRMSVSMLPFYQEEQFKEIGSVAYDNLLSSIVNQERFSMIDRSKIEAVINEMRLSAEGLTDQNSTIKVGKLTAAEGIVMGVVRETPSAIEVYARLVDVESSAILLEKDAFHEDKSLSNLRFLMDGLALKLKHGFPVLEGEIENQKGDSFTINLGANHLVKPGMRVIVFKEEKMMQPETGMVLGVETETLAEAKVIEVYDRMSKIELIKDKITGQVVAKSLVITK